jgi:hypothetical protein
LKKKQANTKGWTTLTLYHHNLQTHDIFSSYRIVDSIGDDSVGIVWTGTYDEVCIHSFYGFNNTTILKFIFLLNGYIFCYYGYPVFIKNITMY